MSSEELLNSNILWVALYLKMYPNPKPEFLKENVVTEANVTYLSTADNLVEMPVSMR